MTEAECWRFPQRRSLAGIGDAKFFETLTLSEFLFEKRVNPLTDRLIVAREELALRTVTDKGVGVSGSVFADRCCRHNNKSRPPLELVQRELRQKCPLQRVSPPFPTACSAESEEKTSDGSKLRFSGLAAKHFRTRSRDTMPSPRESFVMPL